MGHVCWRGPLCGGAPSVSVSMAKHIHPVALPMRCMAAWDHLACCARPRRQGQDAPAVAREQGRTARAQPGGAAGASQGVRGVGQSLIQRARRADAAAKLPAE
eukprot:358722-Chlamydomonas_euryale.AAC.2